MPSVVAKSALVKGPPELAIRIIVFSTVHSELIIIIAGSILFSVLISRNE